MEKKDVVDAKEINSNFTRLGVAMFLITLANFLLKILGWWSAVDVVIPTEQVLVSIVLTYLVCHDIPNYHDSNKANDKKDFQNSVYLFLQLDLAKIFERVVTLTITNILFFLPQNATLPAPFQLIVISMIGFNLFFWSGLKIIERIDFGKLRFFNCIYYYLGFLLIWEIFNLVLPLFLIVDILPHWVLGIILTISYSLIFILFCWKRINNKKAK